MVPNWPCLHLKSACFLPDWAALRGVAPFSGVMWPAFVTLGLVASHDPYRVLLLEPYPGPWEASNCVLLNIDHYQTVDFGRDLAAIVSWINLQPSATICVAACALRKAMLRGPKVTWGHLRQRQAGDFGCPVLSRQDRLPR
jgi:hypothetical protein